MSHPLLTVTLGLGQLIRKGIYGSLPVLLQRLMSCPLGSWILRHLYQVCKTKQVSISAVQAILKLLPRTAFDAFLQQTPVLEERL